MKTILHQVQFCVVGGGLAGMCAAITAARHGIKTLLMHERPVLGGNASSEIRMFICGAENWMETGLIDEIRLENCRRNPRQNFSIWDSVLYEKAAFQENLTLLLNCSCLDAEMDGSKIKSVKGWQLTTQQFHVVEAECFADCSGDSILAELTGAEFRIGREAASEFNESLAEPEADRKTMGMSCLLQARETDRYQPYTAPSWAKKVTEADFVGRGHRLSPRQNYWYLELGGNRDSIGDTETLRDELLALAFGVWDHIKNGGDHGADNWELDWVGFLPGKRESRRYVGDHIMVQDELTGAVEFPDVVAYGGWPVDDHHPDGFDHKGEPNTVLRMQQPYSIPARSLYSKNISNLLFAGRNISTSHIALSSTRVMATCALCGQAAGTIALHALQNGITPRQAVAEHIGDIQNTLLDDDCYLPGKVRKISALTAKAQLTVSRGDGEKLRSGIDRDLDFKHPGNGWRGKAGDFAEYTFAEPEKLSGIRIVFNSYRPRPEVLNSLGQYHKDRPDFALPPTLVRAFHIEVDGKEVYRTAGNSQRLFHLDLDCCAKSVKLVLDDEIERTVFGFDLI
ncbi:MAG: FAD-dependent oxidoreductase [Lentisphaeria bacterium]|nr:FAD-dependent oxidoreductase [Lentisphaeria bacterium]